MLAPKLLCITTGLSATVNSVCSIGIVSPGYKVKELKFKDVILTSPQSYPMTNRECAEILLRYEHFGLPVYCQCLLLAVNDVT